MHSFVYWIGCFFPEGTPVPEGYSFVDLPESDIGVCWIYGKEHNGEIYGLKAHNKCLKSWKENGLYRYRTDFQHDGGKWWWYFERYHSPRFTEKDEKGKVTLDYGMYLL